MKHNYCIKNHVSDFIIHRIESCVFSMTMTLMLAIQISCSDISDDTKINGTEETMILTFNPMLDTDVTATRGQNVFIGTDLTSTSGSKIDIGFWICDENLCDDDHPFVPYSNDMDNMKAEYNPKSMESESWLFTYDNDTHHHIGLRQGSSISIYAYHPYSEFTMDSEFSPRQVPFKAGLDDILWVQPIKDKTVEHDPDSKDKMTVPLIFRHALTCIRIDIKNKHSGSVRLEHATLRDNYSEKGLLYENGTFDITTGDVTINRESSINSIKLENLKLEITNKNYTSVYFILTPIDNYSDGLFSVDFDFGEKILSLPLPCCVKDNEEQHDFISGNMYVYKVDLNNEMTFVTSGTLLDGWGDEETYTLKI